MSPSLSPSPNDKKSNGSEDPLLTYSMTDYISEYLGYKASEASHAHHPTPKRGQVYHAWWREDRGVRLTFEREGGWPRTHYIGGRSGGPGPDLLLASRV